MPCPPRRAMSRRLHRKALPKPASACWPTAPTAVGGSFYLTAKAGLACLQHAPHGLRLRRPGQLLRHLRLATVKSAVAVPSLVDCRAVYRRASMRLFGAAPRLAAPEPLSRIRGPESEAWELAARRSAAVPSPPRRVRNLSERFLPAGPESSIAPTVRGYR